MRLLKTISFEIYSLLKIVFLVCLTGFEPATFGVGVQHSIRLSYRHTMWLLYHDFTRNYDTIRHLRFCYHYPKSKIIAGHQITMTAKTSCCRWLLYHDFSGFAISELDAKVKRSTRSAPADFSNSAQAFAVAPDVKMSSMSNILFP